MQKEKEITGFGTQTLPLMYCGHGGRSEHTN